MSRRGFTLVEVLAATVMAALIATALYGTVWGVDRARLRTSLRTREAALARGILQRIARDLEGAHISKSKWDGKFTHEDRGEPDRPADVLALYTYAGRPDPKLLWELSQTAQAGADLSETLRHLPRTELLQVKYFVNTEVQVADTGLYRWEKRLLPGIEGGEVRLDREVLIAPEVATLDFRFFDGSTWLEQFGAPSSESSGSASSSDLPRAVQITIGLDRRLLERREEPGEAEKSSPPPLDVEKDLVRYSLVVAIPSYRAPVDPNAQGGGS